MIEANEIFKQIKQDSQTIGQVITETNYIMNELKDYRDIYAKANERCKYCGGTLVFTSDLINDRHYLECYDCGKEDSQKNIGFIKICTKYN